MIYQNGYVLQMRLERWAQEHDGDISEFPLDAGIEDICQAIKNYQSQAEAIRVEAERLIDRAKADEKRADALKVSLRGLVSEGEKCIYPTAVISWRKSKAVEVINAEEIPEIYYVTKTEKMLNKTEITKVIKSGEAVAGVILKEKINMEVK